MATAQQAINRINAVYIIGCICPGCVPRVCRPRVCLPRVYMVWTMDFQRLMFISSPHSESAQVVLGMDFQRLMFIYISSLHSESARVVLGMDFQRLDDVDPAAPKALFKQALGQTYMALQEQHTGEFFLVLQWLVVNGWSHAVLQDMMKGSDIADEKGKVTHSLSQPPV